MPPLPTSLDNFSISVMIHQFENDVFISYAHLDNQQFPIAQNDGWVFVFYKTLKIFIGEYLGREPKIWVDKKLKGNDYFDEEIVNQLVKAKLLVSVLSPRYIVSEWCIKELEKFCNYAEQNKCFCVGNKARVCKIIKYPIPLEEYPKELQGLLGYEFFEFEQGAEAPIEFRPEFGDKSLQNFRLKTSDVAKEVSKIIKTKCDCSNDSEEETVVPPVEKVIEPKSASIYLAVTTSDLQIERDKIKRELEARGYTVLPEQPLPLNVPDFENKVREHLKSCTLSIHLIGHKYGVIPEGAEHSVVELQNELAALYSQEAPAFSRLIWMPEELQMPEPRQKEFINSLQDAPEFLQTTLEELKTIIVDKLNPRQQPPKPLWTDANLIRIYLICEEGDFDDVDPLYNYLYNNNRFDVILPTYEGDETQIRQGHENKLRSCDGVIIYWGNVNELWLQKKLRDLQKMAGYGRSIPISHRAIYVGGPQTNQKQRFQTQAALLINNAEASLEDSLEPFLKQFDQGQGGQR